MLTFIPAPFLPIFDNKYCNITRLFDRYEAIPFLGNKFTAIPVVNIKDLCKTYDKGSDIFYIDFSPIKPIEKKRIKISLFMEQDHSFPITTMNHFNNETKTCSFMIFSTFNKERSKYIFILGSDRLSDYEKSFQNYLTSQLSLETIKNIGFLVED